MQFAVLSTGDFGKSRQITEAANSFLHHVNWVQQEAMLGGKALGIQLTSNGYQTKRYNIKQQWEVPANATEYRKQTVPIGISLKAEPRHSNGKTPQVIIDNTGQMSAFSVQFESAKRSQCLIVSGEGYHLEKKLLSVACDEREVR